jgi:hypothetical protein
MAARSVAEFAAWVAPAAASGDTGNVAAGADARDRRWVTTSPSPPVRPIEVDLGRSKLQTLPADDRQSIRGCNEVDPGHFAGDRVLPIRAVSLFVDPVPHESTEANGGTQHGASCLRRIVHLLRGKPVRV